MELLVIRHAIAEDREVFARTGRSDDERPLTREGRAKMRKGAAGLRELVHTVHGLGSSPLVRAWQTAEIIASCFKVDRIDPVDALRPEAEPEELLEWLGTRRPEDRVAVVGHEPHLSALATWLLTGESGHLIELKKGSACLLHFDGPARPAGATIIWLLAPGQLRRLAP